MNLKQMVKNVKNYIKMAAKGEAFIELFDVEDNSVIFEVPTIEDIQVGTFASPDGEFIFADGMKIVISGGVVTEIEKPVVEETIETEVEGKTKGEGEEVIVEEIPADEKDKKIEELEKMVSDLKSQIEELKKDVEEKDSTIEEAEKELEEIKNFYVALNKSSFSNRTGSEEGVPFSFKKIKK